MAYHIKYMFEIAITNEGTAHFEHIDDLQTKGDCFSGIFNWVEKEIDCQIWFSSDANQQNRANMQPSFLMASMCINVLQFWECYCTMYRWMKPAFYILFVGFYVGLLLVLVTCKPDK